MEIIWQTIAAFIAIVGFGLLLEVPQKHIIHAGIAGAVCWLSYLTVLELSLIHIYTSPPATSPRPSNNWCRGSKKAINSRLYWVLRVPERPSPWPT